MTLRRKLTISILVIFFIQAMVGIGLSFKSIADITREQNKTNVEASWNKQFTRFQEMFHRLYKDLVFYKYLIENELGQARTNTSASDLIERCLMNTIAHIAILYDDEGNSLIESHRTGITLDFSIQKSLYSLYDFRFPQVRPTWSNESEEEAYFGIISGSKITFKNKLYYLILFTDMQEHLKKISERSPNFYTVVSNDQRALYSDTGNFEVDELQQEPFSKLNVGNDLYYVFGKPIWGDGLKAVNLSVLYSITNETILLRRIIGISVAVFGGGLFVAMFIAIWVTRKVSGPLLQLNTALKDYLDSGVFKMVRFSETDEIGFLVHTFQDLLQKIMNKEQLIRNQFEQIQLLNSYNESIVENLQSGIVVADATGSIEFCNSYGLYVFEMEKDAVVGNDVKEVLAATFDNSSFLKADFSKKQIFHSLSHNVGEAKHVYVVKTFPILMNSTLESILIMIEDTTETEKLWERTTMADRISSLSLLSAGMAHEVNNPLAAVKSHVDFLMAIEDDSSKRESIGWICNGIKRISAIVDKVTQYMQGTEEEITENINLIIEETCELLHTRIKHQGVQILLNLAPDIPELRISPDLFKQLLLNLVLNAIDACSKDDVITISTEHSDIAGNVKLFVEDTGKGIPPEHLSKVFNPFYSYGKTGKGSGLGLSVCYGIVDRAGGSITIDSEENKGTVVEVSFYENEYSYSG